MMAWMLAKSAKPGNLKQRQADLMQRRDSAGHEAKRQTFALCGDDSHSNLTAAIGMVLLSQLRLTT